MKIGPCPFCGASPEEMIPKYPDQPDNLAPAVHMINYRCGVNFGGVIHDDAYSVVCEKCSAQGPLTLTGEEATRLWNSVHKKCYTQRQPWPPTITQKVTTNPLAYSS
jgi:hypothetical protein